MPRSFAPRQEARKPRHDDRRRNALDVEAVVAHVLGCTDLYKQGIYDDLDEPDLAKLPKNKTCPEQQEEVA